jgi:hypothetical protein
VQQPRRLEPSYLRNDAKTFIRMCDWELSRNSKANYVTYTETHIQKQTIQKTNKQTNRWNNLSLPPKTQIMLHVSTVKVWYKSIHKIMFTIAPICTYGLELWGCASKSNIAIIQRCQSKILRSIVDAPRYVTNATLHTDLPIPTIQEVIHGRSTKHRARLLTHSNPQLQSLSRDTVLRRLKRRWPADL